MPDISKYKEICALCRKVLETEADLHSYLEVPAHPNCREEFEKKLEEEEYNLNFG